MKKFKILALVMTCAILLSSFAIIPVSAATTPAATATNVMGKEIVVDGVKGADEGWSEVPAFTTSVAAKNPANVSNAYTEDTNPSELRFSTDGKKVYMFYELSHDYIVAGESTKISDTTTAVPALHVYFFPENISANAVTSEADSDGFQLSIKLDKAKSLSDTALGENNTVSWNGSDEDASKPNLLWRLYWGDADAESYSGEGFELAVHVDKEGDDRKKVSIEFAFPLPTDVQEALKQGNVTYKTSIWERSDHYGDTVVGNAGYFINTDNPFASNWKFTSDCGYEIVLPQITNTAPVLVGFQSRTNPDDNSKYDVRFVSVVDDYTGFDLNTSKLGYLFNNGTKDSEKQYCTTVYETLNYTKADGSTGTLDPAKFGGTYFFCFTITGMDPAATYDWTVKCFTQADAEDAVEYCKNPVTVKITYDSTEKKAVFTY